MSKVIELRYLGLFVLQSLAFVLGLASVSGGVSLPWTVTSFFGFTSNFALRKAFTADGVVTYNHLFLNDKTCDTGGNYKYMRYAQLRPII